MKKKVYFSSKFYVGEPLAALDPKVELKALEYLLVSLRKRGKHEVAAIVETRSLRRWYTSLFVSLIK